MSGFTVRPERESDAAAVDALLREAFGGPAEAGLVAALRAEKAVVLALVAGGEGGVLGHVLFSRLMVERDGEEDFSAVALAPLAVAAQHREKGIARALIEEGHRRLAAAGETLSVVLGEPTFYGRFGYANSRAKSFASDYQSENLQAMAWSDAAPQQGRLVYARPFSDL